MLGSDGVLCFGTGGSPPPGDGFVVQGITADGRMKLASQESWAAMPTAMSYSDVVQGITADEKEKAILNEQTQRFSAMKLATDGFEPCDSNGEKLVAGTRVQLFGLRVLMRVSIPKTSRIN